MHEPYIITIASEKGGVGKTTLATNLAIYLKGLAEHLPVTVMSFDNHFTVDKLFQLQPSAGQRHVGEMFTGHDPAELVTVGQYAVDYIASCADLGVEHFRPTDVAHLSRVLASSHLSGLVIIDTSPTLDIYTQNALLAAERVIVPVKDAPSLENCRHLADFMTVQQRSRARLKVLPCLIDTRIRFSGPFQNSYQLLKAYAINRGYRCYEGYIAKSPKVESLATNPSGKVYPVITHARNTDVHLQMTHLARQVYLEYLEQTGPSTHQERHATGSAPVRKASRQRGVALHPCCPGCGKNLPNGGVWPHAFYLENARGDFAAFMEKACFLKLLRDCADQLTEQQQDRLFQDLLAGGNESPYLVIRRHWIGNREHIDLFRLDPQGEVISGRGFSGSSATELSGETPIFPGDSADRDSLMRPQLILAREAGAYPMDILRHRAYQQWRLVLDRARIDLPAVPAENSPLPNRDQ